jgi:hypothetical protein
VGGRRFLRRQSYQRIAYRHDTSGYTIKHDGYVINATLDLKRKVYLTIASALVFIVFGYLLIDKFGIAGLCISLICAKFLLFIGQRRLLKSKIQHYLVMSSLKQAQPVVTTFIMLSGALYLTNFFESVSLLKMMALAPVAFVLSFLIFAIFGLRQAQRTELSKIISSIKFFKSN